MLTSNLAGRMDQRRTHSARPSFKQITAPNTEPLSLAEAKAHLKVQHSGEDSLITSIIAAARTYVESGWGLALISQSWRATADWWPADGLPLRPYPVGAITAVRVWDGSSMATQSLSGFLLIEGRQAYAAVQDGASTPIPSRSRSGIEVDFTTGWEDAAHVPEDIKQALRLLIAHWYRNRSASLTALGRGVSSDIIKGVSDLMAAYRSPRLA